MTDEEYYDPASGAQSTGQVREYLGETAQLRRYRRVFKAIEEQETVALCFTSIRTCPDDGLVVIGCVPSAREADRAAMIAKMTDFGFSMADMTAHALVEVMMRDYRPLLDQVWPDVVTMVEQVAEATRARAAEEQPR